MLRSASDQVAQSHDEQTGRYYEVVEIDQVVETGGTWV